MKYSLRVGTYITIAYTIIINEELYRTQCSEGTLESITREIIYH